MALLFVDGFDHYNLDAFFTKWDGYYSATRTGVSSSYGRNSSGGLWLDDLDDAYVLKNLGSLETTLIIGFAFKLSTSFNTDPVVYMLENGSIQMRFDVNGNGSISAFRGTTLLGTTALGVLSADTWQYLEFKVVFHNTTGTVDVQVDGVSELSLSGQDTVATATVGADGFHLRGEDAGTGRYFDDLYVCNGSGSTNNDFLGDVRVHTLYPTSDGNSSDFTPASGSDNYAMVDTTPFAGAETDNVESSTVGHKDLYGVTTYSGTGSVLGVQVNVMCRNTDVGSMSTRTLCRSGATPTDNEGSSFALSSSYNDMQTVHEEEPTDSVSWTAAKINAAEFGVKVQS